MCSRPAKNLAKRMGKSAPIAGAEGAHYKGRKVSPYFSKMRVYILSFPRGRLHSCKREGRLIKHTVSWFVVASVVLVQTGGVVIL